MFAVLSCRHPPPFIWEEMVAPGGEGCNLQVHGSDWNVGLPALRPVLGKCSRDVIGDCARSGSGKRQACCFLLGCPPTPAPASALAPLSLSFLIHTMGMIRELLPLGCGRLKWLRSVNSPSHSTWKLRSAQYVVVAIINGPGFEPGLLCHYSCPCKEASCHQSGFPPEPLALVPKRGSPTCTSFLSPIH